MGIKEANARGTKNAYFLSPLFFFPELRSSHCETPPPIQGREGRRKESVLTSCRRRSPGRQRKGGKVAARSSCLSSGGAAFGRRKRKLPSGREEAALDFFSWREEWEAGRRGRSHFAEAGRGKRRGMQEVAFKGRGRNIEGGGGGGAGCCSS